MEFSEPWIGYVLAGVLGAAIGSFLNVVIYRLNTGRSLQGSSHCLSCGVVLSWYELFPVASYVVLLARCRHCGARIPSRYMLVELLTAGLFLLGWHLFHADLIALALNGVLFSLLVVITIYDIRHTIIPDVLVIYLAGLALGFLGYHVYQNGDWLSALFDVLGGVGASLFFFGLWLVSHGRWIGLGDAKLAMPLGVIVGVTSVFSMVVLSFWIGAVISVALIGVQHLLKKGKTHLPFLSLPLTIKSEVPFAPFLVLGFLCAYLFNANIFSLTYMFLS